jgi:hypothetical protein
MNPAVLASLIALVLALPPAIDKWLAGKVKSATKLAYLVMLVGVGDAGAGALLTQLADGAGWKTAAAVALAGVFSGLAFGIKRLTSGGGGDSSGGSATGDPSPATGSSSTPSPAAVSPGGFTFRERGFIGVVAASPFLGLLVLGLVLDGVAIGCSGAQRAQEVQMLEQEPMACALATELVDEAAVKALCLIADEETPALEQLLAGKARAAADAGAADGGADR